MPAGLLDYWRVSRAPRYSILIALPLLVVYEALAAFLSTGQGAELRNGADVLLEELFLAIAGRQYASVAFGLTVIGVGLWYVARDIRRTPAPLRGRVFATMIAEAAALALCFGSVVGTLTAHLVRSVPFPHRSVADAIVHVGMVAPVGGPIATAPTATKVMLALGAGVYEELLFRVLLVSGIALIARRLLGWRPLVAAGVAVTLSALIFAAFHYVGPYGDPWRLDSFVFRLLGGLAFSLLYVTRGFGITAWTHALYDLLVLTV